MKNERLKKHTRGKKQDLGWKTSGEDEGFEGKVFGREKRKILSREIGEKWNKNHARSI